MLIGLHKMAAERGDGVIPEMLDMVRDRTRALEATDKLVQFPERRNEPRETVRRPASNENNVIAFPARRRVVLNR